MQLKKIFFLLMMIVIGMFMVVACSPASPSTGPGQADQAKAQEQPKKDTAPQETTEHNMDHMHVDPPAEFKDLVNPYAGNEQAVIAGQKIFETNCVTCHGPQGLGDGAAAAGLNPKPANLGDSQMMQDLTDAYLFWRVSQGGAMAPFNSAMPAWKESLSEEQIWQTVTYVRTFSNNSDHQQTDHQEEHAEHN